MTQNTKNRKQKVKSIYKDYINKMDDLNTQRKEIIEKNLKRQDDEKIAQIRKKISSN